jgi:hypothetical protein
MHRKSIPTTYDEAREALGGRSSRVIAHNTRLVDLDSESIALRLHSTNVVIFRLDGSLVLDSGGWRSVTTKDRINRAIRARGWTVFAKARTWYIAHRESEPIPFEDGHVIPTPARERGRDASLENHGSIHLVRPLTECAVSWLDENTDGTWFGNALAVEHRFVADLVAGMRESGLVVVAA